jgi:hypothetical protein
VKFEVTAKFASDLRRLKPEHLAEFKKVLREKFVPACDGFALDPTTPWPASLRVKSMRAAPGIFEMTWSFASPDGRATFEILTIDGEARIRWRRIGDHGVFREP